MRGEVWHGVQELQEILRENPKARWGDGRPISAELAQLLALEDLTIAINKLNERLYDDKPNLVAPMRK